MFMRRIAVNSSLSQTHLVTLLLLSAMTVAWLALPGHASATLIGDSLEYDGHVKSGTSTGVEQHLAAPAFPPITFALHVTNSALTAPLQPAHALSGSETEFIDALNGQLGYQHVVITIQGPTPTDDVFVNSLDASFARPITFDGVFHSSSLAAGKKISIDHMGIEAITAIDAPPFGDPAMSTITGIGSVANPLHVHFELTKSQLQSNEAVKIHLYYKTIDNSVPEPSTGAILVIALSTLGSMSVTRAKV
jgi:hypothetical protein